MEDDQGPRPNLRDDVTALLNHVKGEGGKTAQIQDILTQILTMTNANAEKAESVKSDLGGY